MLCDVGSESLRNLNLECSCTTFSRKKDRLQKYFLILEISLLKNNNPKSKPDEFASEIATEIASEIASEVASEIFPH